MKSFSNGKLIRVRGGTHGATTQASRVDKEFLNYVIRFVEADDPVAAGKELPAAIDLGPLEFAPLGKPTLFDQLVGK